MAGHFLSQKINTLPPGDVNFTESYWRNIIQAEGIQGEDSNTFELDTKHYFPQCHRLLYFNSSFFVFPTICFRNNTNDDSDKKKKHTLYVTLFLYKIRSISWGQKIQKEILLFKWKKRKENSNRVSKKKKTKSLS